MKSIEQQFASLDLVAKAAIKRVVNCVTRSRQGDVVTLVADGVAKPHEIIAASLNDKYDIWKSNHIIETDVPLERAVEVVVKDYKDHKIDLIMTHFYGPRWKQLPDMEKALQMVTADIYDDEKQRAYSEQARKRSLQ